MSVPDSARRRYAERERGLIAPMNLAAFVTWLAVAIDALEWPSLLAGAPRELAGAGLLGAFAVIYVVDAILDARGEGRSALPAALLQAACALAASHLLRSGTVAVLLILVAAALFICLPPRRASLWMVAINALLLALWAPFMPLPRLLLVFLPVVGFQMFAALVALYARRAEEASEALAGVNAQLLATRELLAQSARAEERLKLSRELHDVAGHKLTALKLNLAQALRAGAPARAPVETSLQLATELLDDIRAVVGELRRHEGVELVDALRALVAPIPGPRFDLALDAAPRVASVEVAEALLRCAQEGITNALRHGRPTRIALIVERAGDDLRLVVRDDGSDAARIVFGNGLKGMRERLEDLGGRLEVASVTPRGVELRATLPSAA